jgi:hypothetical protein
MPKLLRVRDLPPPIPGRALPNGGYVEARQPSLYCPHCDASYSANPGDYWAANPATVLRCVCGERLRLVMTRTVHEEYVL